MSPNHSNFSNSSRRSTPPVVLASGARTGADRESGLRRLQQSPREQELASSVATYGSVKVAADVMNVKVSAIYAALSKARDLGWKQAGAVVAAKGLL